MKEDRYDSEIWNTNEIAGIYAHAREHLAAALYAMSLLEDECDVEGMPKTRILQNAARRVRPRLVEAQMYFEELTVDWDTVDA